MKYRLQMPSVQLFVGNELPSPEERDALARRLGNLDGERTAMLVCLESDQISSSLKFSPVVRIPPAEPLVPQHRFDLFAYRIPYRTEGWHFLILHSIDPPFKKTTSRPSASRGARKPRRRPAEACVRDVEKFAASRPDARRRRGFAGQEADLRVDSTSRQPRRAKRRHRKEEWPGPAARQQEEPGLRDRSGKAFPTARHECSEGSLSPSACRSSSRPRCRPRSDRPRRGW